MVPKALVAATSSLGSVTVLAKAGVSITGVSATGELGEPFVWSLIDESQTPNFSEINEDQTPSFTTIDDSQTPNWEDVA